MDERLYTVGQYSVERPQRLRQDDLPTVTRLLIAVIRGRGKARNFRVKAKDFVELISDEGAMVILRDDWVLIEPYLIDGTFDPLQTPAGATNVAYLNPRVAYGESVLDRADYLLYLRILGVLSPLFPEAFPKSDL